MQQALALDVPTLPQLPREDPAEFMLPEALAGLPGLSFDREGRTTVDPVAWASGAKEFGRRLDAALGGDGLATFEPPGSSCRAWKPFLWEIEQRKAPFAKAQVAGPLTTLWASSLADGRPLSAVPGLGAQIVRLVVARALAMTAAIKSTGATPILFLDEPGLYAFDKRIPTHVVELQELSFAIQALRKAGAIVGLHCCSNTNWAMILGLEFDIVSADTRLSLAPMLGTGAVLDTYLARGGWLGLGIIPTNSALRPPVEDVVAEALTTMGDKRRAILARSVLSPACGLALRSVAEVEQIFDELHVAQQLIRANAG